MFRRFSLSFVILCVAMFASLCPKSSEAQQWTPIAPEELAMKDNPTLPGSQAMILYREQLADANQATQNFYYRVKIFTEEGKKQGDVEIGFVKNLENVKDIHGRTVHPDGQAIEFDGQAMDKLIVKAGDIKVLAKTFTLPDVTPGSVIEYRYKVQRNSDFLWGDYWSVQDALYTKRAHFAYRPYSGPVMAELLWRAQRLPQGVAPQKQKDGSFAMDVSDIQGVPEEEYMVPVEELRARVTFIYTTEETTKDPKEFWDRVAKKWADSDEHYIGKRAGIRQAVDQTVAANDSPEVKLRKIYARAQQIRNLNAEEEKTSQEEKRDKTKANENVEDVLKRGYGTARQINLVFIAMAQAAGFDADTVWTKSRGEGVFHSELENPQELDVQFAWVHAGDKEYFLNPGQSLCPFDILPWYETGVSAMRPTKQGAVFVKTPMTPVTASRTERVGKFTLGMDGMLKGTLTVRYTGERALSRREDGRNEDDAGKRKLILDEMKQWLPSNSNVELAELNNWDKPDEPLEAQYTITMPANIEAAGRRALFPLGVYYAGRPQLFEHSSRQQQIYFHFP